MKKVSLGRRLFLLVAAAVLVVGALALASCSCSNQQGSTSGSGSSASGDVMYTVPNVVSLTQADAEKAVLASGLQVGTIKQEASDTVPLGSVISQTPEPLTNAKANSKVDLVVSSGKAELKDVVVPDLKDKTQHDAEKALSDVGLVGVASNPEETSEVQPGHVFKQSVAAGAKVKEGTKVAFTVATAPGEATVPNVVGMTRDDAKKSISDAKLGFDSTTAYNDNVDEGKVIAQSLPADSKVKQGTTVSVQVSLGPKPVENVTVPDVMSFSWSDAEASLHSAGLAARYTGDPAGVVVSQDVAAGTKVAPNTLVTVTLSAPVQYVEVPDLTGMSLTAAEQATDALNLALDADGSEGTVVSQSPTAGTQVTPRTTVNVSLRSHETEEIEKYLGSWQDDKASLKVDTIGSDVIVTIEWDQGSGETYSWKYTVKVKGDKLVCSDGGSKFVSEDGGDPKTVYTDGSAEFSINKDGMLIWKDKKEDAGKGLKFAKLLQ